MQYIKVLASTSTNTELKNQFRAKQNMPNTCLIADHQISGRGQRGSGWHTDPGKNLTISILIKNLNLKPQEAFKINILVCLSLVDYLNQHIKADSFYVKWPNDILSGHQKLCGVLIENILGEKLVKHAVIGIGLNVNQTDFKALNKATSLKKITNANYRLPQLIEGISKKVETNLYDKKDLDMQQLIEEYTTHLYGLNKSELFEFPNGTQQRGIIIGIDPSGLLKIKFDQTIKTFDLKEIKMIY